MLYFYLYNYSTYKKYEHSTLRFGSKSSCLDRFGGMTFKFNPYLKQSMW